MVNTVKIHLYLVATASTVYGIETSGDGHISTVQAWRLQQHLPFTVLKHRLFELKSDGTRHVATASTVYGIETYGKWLG